MRRQSGILSRFPHNFRSSLRDSASRLLILVAGEWLTSRMVSNLVIVASQTITAVFRVNHHWCPAQAQEFSMRHNVLPLGVRTLNQINSKQLLGFRLV